jgi:hypothetical protein
MNSKTLSIPLYYFSTSVLSSTSFSTILSALYTRMGSVLLILVLLETKAGKVFHKHLLP